MGSYVDSVSQADPASMTRLMNGLDEFLERDQDRALFNLVPTGNLVRGLYIEDLASAW